MATQLTLNDGSLNSAGALAIKTNGTTQAINITTGQQVEFNDGSASAPSITNTGDGNTGIFFPDADTVGITTGGTERARVDSSGNLGLGVTPSAWINSSKGLQINTRAALAGDTTLGTNLTDNLYIATGPVFKYLTTAAGTVYLQNSGTHQWYNTPSGTAGTNATVTQAMTLDASGNLGVGTTSPSTRLHASGTGSQELRVTANTSGDIRIGMDLSGTYYNWIDSYRASGAMVFATDNTERARIDSSGRWLVNTTANTSGANCFAEIYGGNSTKAGLNIRGDGSSGTRFFLSFFVGTSTNVGTISSDGTTTTYSTSSDYRLKENIAPMTGALNVVAQLKPCTYTWRETGEAGQGFIAHELQAVLPDAVTGEKDAVNEDGSIKPQGIDTSFLVATLTAAIQELKAEFDAYKASHP